MKASKINEMYVKHFVVTLFFNSLCLNALCSSKVSQLTLHKSCLWKICSNRKSWRDNTRGAIWHWKVALFSWQELIHGMTISGTWLHFIPIIWWSVAPSLVILCINSFIDLAGWQLHRLSGYLWCVLKLCVCGGLISYKLITCNLSHVFSILKVVSSIQR